EGQGQLLCLCEANTPCGPKVTAESDRRFHAVYETEHGAAEAEHSGYRPVASLGRAGGWTAGVGLRGLDSGLPECLALGVSQGQGAFAPLPGVSPAEFRPGF